MTRRVPVLLTLVLILISSFPALAQDGKEFVVGKMIQLNDNGAWSWFMDERAIVDGGRLIIGSVRANGRFEHRDRPG